MSGEAERGFDAVNLKIPSHPLQALICSLMSMVGCMFPTLALLAWRIVTIYAIHFLMVIPKVHARFFKPHLLFKLRPLFLKANQKFHLKASLLTFSLTSNLLLSSHHRTELAIGSYPWMAPEIMPDGKDVRYFPRPICLG